MSVKVSGPVLSSLFYEHNNTNCDREGFLLGKVASHVTDTISDSQINNVKEETVTYIHSYMPCETPGDWYESDGSVAVDTLKQLFPGEKHKEVIGWYKFRRNSTMAPSFRERLLHNNLKECFPGLNNMHFLFLLGTSYAAVNISTYSFDHVFLHFNGSVFQSLPLTVVNLGDTAHSQYKLQPSHTVRPDFGLFANTVQAYGGEFVDNTGTMQSVTGIHTLNSKLNLQLQRLCEQVAKSEREVGQLDTEVRILHEQLENALSQRMSHTITKQGTGTPPLPRRLNSASPPPPNLLNLESEIPPAKSPPSSAPVHAHGDTARFNPPGQQVEKKGSALDDLLFLDQQPRPVVLELNQEDKMEVDSTSEGELSQSSAVMEPEQNIKSSVKLHSAASNAQTKPADLKNEAKEVGKDTGEDTQSQDQRDRDHFSFIGDMIKGNMRSLALKSPIKDLVSRSAPKSHTSTDTKSMKTSHSLEDHSSSQGVSAAKVERSSSMKNELMSSGGTEDSDSSMDCRIMDPAPSSSPTF